MSRVVGHHAPRLLVALVGALIVLTLVPAISLRVPWEALACVQIGVLALTITIFAHNRHLCARCIAAVPLDASGVAARYAARFQVAHAFERKRYAIGYLGVIVGTAFVSEHPIGRYAWAVVQASLAYLLIAYVTHQRLQPWCPRCKNGGEELTVPTAPTPVSTNA